MDKERPKPVITIYGDTDLIGPVLQKKLQARLKTHQLSSEQKEDPPCSAFSTLCDGVEFVLLTTALSRPKASKGGQNTPPLYQLPALHTFWTECSNTDQYRIHHKQQIVHWLSLMDDQVATGGGQAECLIIYCITAEVRAKRHRTLSVNTVEDRIRSDFKGKADDVLQLRLASSEEARVLDSLSSFTARLNLSCLTKFRKGIEKEAEAVAKQRETRCEPDGIYDIFVQKLNLAVTYEMTLQNEEALQLYREASADLEEALATYSKGEGVPVWVEEIRKAPCTSWDYPKLVWTNLAWRYVPVILAGSSPLLHTHTFLLGRISHLLFERQRAWTVSELTIETLHCMARQIKLLELSLPEGAFDCWAYMTCNEAIQAIMMRISADSLISATSSLLLVRAELWNYALTKLHAIGVLCGLMPSSNIQNHDKVLIGRITAGITLVQKEDVKGVDGMEDQGQKLKEILNNRKTFHTAYLTLGEMVIGAFKHAGRRRMAFRVGTMMAQFHRDLGLVNEAEDLLSDICKFYSEDQWMQLSTKAYSLLADCQMRLKMEDKHVTTMLLLASLPAYPGAGHDPCKWLDSLMHISQRSPYQKILNWEPLLELVAIHFREGGGGGGGGRYSYTVEEEIKAELIVRYNGPKEMTPVIASLLLHSSTDSKPLQLESTPGSNSSPSQKTPPSSLTSLGNLDELDLELDTSQQPHSRPIGQHTKLRSTANVVTLIRSTDIVGEGEGGEDWRGKVPEFMLMTMKVKLQPGENRIMVSGETNVAGDYFPHKVSLKWGSLDFVYTVSPTSQLCHSVAVEPTRVVLDMGLVPEMGVFLSGYPLNCTLTLKTGSDTSVPENSSIRIVTRHPVHCSTTDSNASHHDNSQDGNRELTIQLSSIAQDSELAVPLNLLISSMQPTSPSSSAVDVASSHDQTDQSHSCAWQHEMQVCCDWLSPVHVAKIPLLVYEPITLMVKEHSAGRSTFLQLLLENTCPLPVGLSNSSISTDLELTRLHGELPAVLYPHESYSCIWQVGPGTPTTGKKSRGSFHLKCRPVIAGKETSDQEYEFHFSPSKMQTLYEIQGVVEPIKEAATVVVSRSAILRYDVRNVSKEISKQPSKKLYYRVHIEGRYWAMLDSRDGVMNAPTPGQTVQLLLLVSPNATGPLLLPTLTLYKCPDDFNPVSSPSPEEISDVELVQLTNAQVYNLSYGDIVNVIPSIRF